jgi:MYXO-CTERM domain-containing protein
VFEPSTFAATGRLRYTATRKSLDACDADVIDRALADRIRDRQSCATTYCGSGECVLTDEGPACSCAADTVAREFVDLDGELSVTCVPSQPLVDLEAGGIDLPDVCAVTDCGSGSCVDLGGFAACDCADGSAAAVGNNPGAPVCRSITALSGSVGAEDFSRAIDDVRVCAPAAPVCGETGWLERREVSRPGVACNTAPPDQAAFIPPPEPTCDRAGFFGCGCSSSNGPGAGGLVLCALVAIAVRRRRRKVSL